MMSAPVKKRKLPPEAACRAVMRKPGAGTLTSQRGAPSSKSPQKASRYSEMSRRTPRSSSS